MRIVMVSEHASPLAALGEVDSGGLTALARQGHEVVVYPRRADPDLPA